MRRLFAALALALCAAIVPAHADNFPSRTITLIVPYPPGGSTDVAGRILADKMGTALGQPVIVENVGGAGGSIGVGRSARSVPDGYTIDIGQWDTHVGGIIYNLSYDLQNDFAPIGMVSFNPQLLVARKAFPADDLKSLVAWMKAHPGDAKLVNQNAGGQIGGLLLEQKTDTKLLLVAYRGAAPGITDMIGGQVDMMIAQGAVTLPQVRAGTLKAIVNLSAQRSPSIPEIPTSDESGVPGLYVSGWFGLYAPQGYAGRHYRQAQCRHGGGAGRPCRARALCRAWARRRAAGAADAGGFGSIHQGRDRQMVADHQGRRHRGE